ncbi:MAG: TetR family transcriptional regulator [Streptosporangiales bacterium]|nr:TetR family transcriptional regulator [Streptosporangiales bacterium]
MAARGKPRERRPGRPRAGERRLDREAILEAALRIVDDDGLEALSMRRLASALGVNPMSIYHHLPGKAAVLSGLVREVFAQVSVTVPTDDASWQDRLKHAARAYRGVLRTHRNLALQIVSDTAAVSDSLVVAGEPFYEALERAGLPPRSVVDGVNTLVDFIHGFMLGEASSTEETFDLGPDLLERVRQLPPGAAPALTRVTEALGEDGLRYEFDAGFESGLDIVVRGIEAGVVSNR